MLILKKNSTFLDSLALVKVQPGPLQLLPTRKGIKLPAKPQKGLTPRQQEVMEQLRRRGFNPYVDPQTNWIIAPTQINGVRLKVDPSEKSKDFTAALINPLGHKVGPQAQACKDMKHLGQFLLAAGVSPSLDKESGKERAINLHVANSSFSRTRAKPSSHTILPDLAVKTAQKITGVKDPTDLLPKPKKGWNLFGLLR